MFEVNYFIFLVIIFTLIFIKFLSSKKAWVNFKTNVRCIEAVRMFYPNLVALALIDP